MGYVPDDWLTAELEHNVRSWRVGFFSRMLTCTCGLSARSHRALYDQHWASELDIRQWIEQIQQKKAKRLNAMVQAERQHIQQKYKGQPIGTTNTYAGPKPTNADSDTLNF